MTRSSKLRLHTLIVAAAFTAAGGLSGFDTHPLATHGPHGLLAMESGGTPPGSDAPTTRHSGHSEHGSSTRCTCLGACAGGGAPAFSDGDGANASLAPDAVVRDRPSSAEFVQRDPRSYLLPFPNPPPTQA